MWTYVFQDSRERQLTDHSLGCLEQAVNAKKKPPSYLQQFGTQGSGHLALSSHFLPVVELW